MTAHAQPSRAATLRAGLRKGDARLRGTFQGLAMASVTEILASAGPDFICIDGEHASVRGETLANLARAADLHLCPLLLRVPDGLPHIIGEALDAGVAGILVPRIPDIAAAARAVSFARFPPDGIRGVGPGRAAGYGYSIGEILNGEPPLVGVQIETLGALDNLEDILAVPGLDFVMIGPGDLSVTLAANRPDLPLEQAIGRIREAARAADMPCGIFTPDRAASETALDWAAFVIQGSDAMMLHAAASQSLPR
ncbi:HpcH/HpaI aldolase/citrate lyase family protein [Tropicimonas sp. IMCC34011]|uniref:HpcH/HpaI aldolase family protein n=1 Tax=Tropicimonas sp. IMCC34011 TaxID=2248759 RepID=UPI000E24BFD5|nr:aldolase/citrate lyase family protein [Tropicimonas sp. IMCC34011]